MWLRVRAQPTCQMSSMVAREEARRSQRCRRDFHMRSYVNAFVGLPDGSSPLHLCPGAVDVSCHAPRHTARRAGARHITHQSQTPWLVQRKCVHRRVQPVRTRHARGKIIVLRRTRMTSRFEPREHRGTSGPGSVASGPPRNHAPGVMAICCVQTHWLMRQAARHTPQAHGSEGPRNMLYGTLRSPQRRGHTRVSLSLSALENATQSVAQSRSNCSAFLGCSRPSARLSAASDDPSW